MTFALLTFAAFVAAVCSGGVGFGGAMLLLPIVTSVMGPDAAIPSLTLIQVVSNGSRVLFGKNQIDWRAVKLFLLTAAPSSILGAWLFVSAPKELILKVIGITMLLLIALKLTVHKKFSIHHSALPWLGLVVGFISGLVGTAGPLGAGVFLALNLKPVSFVSTDALSSLAMHLVKFVVYQQAVDIDKQFLLLTACMCVSTMFGTFVGNKIVQKLPENLFRKIAVVFLVITSAQLIIGN